MPSRAATARHAPDLPGPAQPPAIPVAAHRPLRVCAFPKDRFRATQPFHALLAEAVEGEGLAVEEFGVRRCLSARYDILHLHHPEKFVSPRLTLRTALRFAAFFAVLWWQRMRGARIVWTAHNEGPHEPGHPLLERLYWPLFLPALDGVIYLSDSSRGQLVRQRPRLGRLPGFVIPHGDFRGAYRDDITAEQARDRLGYGPDDIVLAFVGNVRDYKNAGHLARTVSQLADPRLRLLIAGHVHTDALRTEIVEVARKDPRIRLVEGFIGEDDMQVYLRAADLVVLPFRRILNSGTAILALSFDRPVLVPDLGSLRELQGMVGADWVHLFRGDLTPDLLLEVLARLDPAMRQKQAPLDRLSWPVIGKATADAYRSLI